MISVKIWRVKKNIPLKLKCLKKSEPGICHFCNNFHKLKEVSLLKMLVFIYSFQK